MSRVRRTAAFVALWHFIRGQSRPGAPSLATRINAFPRLVGAVRPADGTAWVRDGWR